MCVVGVVVVGVVVVVLLLLVVAVVLLLVSRPVVIYSFLTFVQCVLKRKMHLAYTRCSFVRICASPRPNTAFQYMLPV